MRLRQEGIGPAFLSWHFSTSSKYCSEGKPRNGEKERGEKERRREGEKETRRQGDKEREELNLEHRAPHSFCQAVVSLYNFFS